MCVPQLKCMFAFLLQLTIGVRQHKVGNEDAAQGTSWLELFIVADLRGGGTRLLLEMPSSAEVEG